MVELTTDNAEAYLRSAGHIDAGSVQVDWLSGGVSNVVLRVTTPDRRFVLKQSCPQLRTRDAWFSDLDRVWREMAVMQALHGALPAAVVPEVLFCDRDNFAFAMSHAPTPFRVWKESLLAGEIDAGLGAQVGRVLGRMHQVSATDPRFAQQFADARVFVQLRIDPFYRTIQRRIPDLADAIEPIVARMLAPGVALCHGDYTPKNILTHAQGFTLVDYETAYFGDPTMDLGLLLCHLLLKAFRAPQQAAAFLELTDAVWAGYTAEVRFRPIAELQTHAVEHLAVCLLARVDGTSPVDYLDDERRAAVRRVSRALLQARLQEWSAVRAVFAEGIAHE